VKEDIFVGQKSGTDGVTQLEYPFAAQFSGGSGACIGFPKGFVPVRCEVSPTAMFEHSVICQLKVDGDCQRIKWGSGFC
jgi:hypothetical protein